MSEYNLLKTHPKIIRNIKARKDSKTEEIIRISRQYGKEYYDGDRAYGYGGYKYDGRWKVVAEAIVERYGLKKGDKVLDIGCAKGFLVKDLLSIGIDAYGIDVSEYALENCEPEAKGRLQIASADTIPFADKSFAFTISTNTLHNLERDRCIVALKEMERLAPSGKGFVQVDSYRTPHDKELFLNWVLTAKTHYYPKGWIELFKEANYTGDYYWTIFSN